MKYIIYALTDPETKEIRYIGMSSCGLVRPKEHIKAKNLKTKSHKVNWIKTLLAKGLIYEISVLEVLQTPEGLSEREQFWIAHYRAQGSNLTNLTNGGEGSPGYRFSKESKRKMSETRLLLLQSNPGLTERIADSCRKKPFLIDGIQYQNCSDCKSDKPLETSFYKNRKRWNGYDSMCKECGNIRLKKRAQLKKLSPEEFQQTYETRKKAMSRGAKAYFDSNPDAKKHLAEKRSKPIEAHNPETGEVLKFDSALNAKEKGFQNSNIGQAIKYKTLYKGYYWKFA